MRHKGVEIKSKEDVLKYLDFNIYSTNHLDNCNQKKFNEFGCFIAHL